MVCYRPLTAWRGPVLPSGKRKVVFKAGESTPSLIAFPLKLPCGQCIGCRLDYSLKWAVRCLYEAQMHSRNCFITLTYSDEFLPADQSLDVGEWQRFIKRLRKQVGVRFRYYHAGEYGERFGRPHYHALLFGLDFEDKKLFKKTESGSSIYTSEILSSVWNKGFCSIGEVTFESAAYVARYCLKKVNGDARDRADGETGLKPYERVSDYGEVVDVRPEYVTMSRRPGIARAWYDRYRSDVYPHGYCVSRGGVKMPPPRYFDGLYEVENPLDMKRLKLLRSARGNRREVVFNDVLRKDQMLEVNRDDRLAVMEVCKEASVKLLRRVNKESGQ